jgi:hypothetical protein
VPSYIITMYYLINVPALKTYNATFDAVDATFDAVDATFDAVDATFAPVDATLPSFGGTFY